MKFKKYIFFLSNLLYITSSLFCISNINQESDYYTAEPEILTSEKKINIQKRKTKITIRANIQDAEVYLNGQYEGNTDLTINNLPEGRYHLRVEKDGYKPRRFVINVRAGEEEFYYIELKKLFGIVTFESSVKDCSIYVDGSKIYEESVKLAEGEHSVKIEKFGYKTQQKNIYVFRNTHQVVSFDLKLADFYLTSFKTNKKSFNPNLPGASGTIKFSFYVSTYGSGLLTIYDEFLNEICSIKIDHFNTWNQIINWNGKNSSGHSIPNGKYIAIIKSANFSETINFYVDNSIKLPKTSITASGTGLGVLPTATIYPEDSTILEISGGPVFSTEETLFSVPLSVSIGLTPFSWLEITGKTGFFAATEGSPCFLNGAVKSIFKYKNDSFNINYGFLLRAGGSEDIYWEPFGADTGNGFGGGILIGLETNKFFLGASSEIVWGSVKKVESTTDCIIRNGISTQLKTKNINLGLFISNNSSFGHSTELKDTRNKNNLFRAFEGGIDISIQPFSSQFLFSIKESCLIFNEIKYFKSEIGFRIIL